MEAERRTPVCQIAHEITFFILDPALLACRICPLYAFPRLPVGSVTDRDSDSAGVREPPAFRICASSANPRSVSLSHS